MAAPRVYVASPLGFSAPGVRYLREVLHPALAAAGLEVLDPWADPDGVVRAVLEMPAGSARIGALTELNRHLGATNAAAIDSADVVLAVLDGADVDSGTASEIGYAAARGCPVVGLRTDTRRSGDNDAAVVNLQVLYFIDSSGGTLEERLSDALSSITRIVSTEGAPDPPGAPAHRPETGDADLVEGFIYHLTLLEVWEMAVEAGSYETSTREASLAEVGFIHASFAEQLATTAARFYGDVPSSELIVLEIDPSRLTAPVLVEASSGGERFPHIYGPLNLDAVTALLDPP